MAKYLVITIYYLVIKTLHKPLLQDGISCNYEIPDLVITSRTLQLQNTIL